MKICVAMSGGVDSSVAATVLKREGHDVFGVFMKLWDEEGAERGCCSLNDSRDALRVAETLGMPFYVLNMKDEFRSSVVDQFIAEYLQGRTPNPCIQCNRLLKFDSLLSRARTFGATHIATGHYARILPRGDGWSLHRGLDRGKDQSYFLFNIPRETLGSVLFPLGSLHKEEVRRIAEDAGLRTAKKPESQEICFVSGDYRDFLKQRGIHTGKGVIVDKAGKVLGEHDGFFNFTIGQRSGLNVALGYPVYVVDIVPDKNLVVAGKNEELFKSAFIVENCTFFDEPAAGAEYLVKVRYRHAGELATISPASSCSYIVTFKTPQRGITPGQAAVFYDGDCVLGGGWIRKVLADGQR